jgi:subtilisin family serine protease
MSIIRDFKSNKNKNMRFKDYVLPSIIIISLQILFLSLLTTVALAQTLPLDKNPPKYPAETRGENSGSQKSSSLEKLAPELQILSEQFTPTRGGQTDVSKVNGIGGYTLQQLREIFGIADVAGNPVINLVVEVTAKTKIEDLKKAGAKIYFRLGTLVYLSASVSALPNLSSIGDVNRIGLLKSMNIPKPPASQTTPIFDFPSRGNEQKPLLKNQFNKQGLTGKGVIVGIIDSGIDWTHPDFIRADGTSRVLLLWDITDNSWESSGGKIGSAPPAFSENDERLPGTLYTNEQINAALKNKEKVNSLDKVGHGTAVAGTAAGNGRGASDETMVDDYRGIAPDADLIVVKVGDCENSVSALAAIGAYWTANTAKILKRPAVINLSLGSHYTAHDGNSEEEQLLDRISDSVKGFGIPVVVAAGNEGRLSLHAGSSFGSRRPGQVDIASQPIDAVVNQPSLLLATFDRQDDWGLVFRSSNSVFLGSDGKPASIYLSKSNGNFRIETDASLANEEQFKQFLQTVRQTNQSTTDSLMLQLIAGQYVFYGFGASSAVSNGRFDLYLLSQDGASFGLGTEKRFMVSSPGNAAKVITVGSSDFRSEWENSSGQTSRFNLREGEVSDYSSPGPRRDGLTKPEIVAPGRYTIASLSKFSIPENGGCKGSMVADSDQRKIFITKSKNHLAWSGTSAATPFVTGVIALMLQKNPNLKADQIKQILIKTASGRAKNDQAVNDERLGYGNIEPETTLKNVPFPIKANTRGSRY